MSIEEYLSKINILYRTGNAREHAYRGDLANLIMSIVGDILVTNEPARVACGAPDYVLTRKEVPVGYIEAKDIGVDLLSKGLKEQFDRYKAGLSNLIFTDYMEFHFYKEGVLTTKIAIAKLEHGNIVPIRENFDQFSELIRNFTLTVTQTIKSPTKLAQMMAGKAKLMADVIEKSLTQDDKEEKRSQLKSQMLSFQQMLIHDIDNKSFSDIYAQTIAYGMFAARYHDPTLPTFSRMEAAELIPKSNPFLRKLFQDIAGFDLDSRLVWIVDELINIFLASDVAEIMKNFGKSTKQEDPVVHFYETFLGEYNPALRKARGVWYTPQPVVNFIVRAVDDILKSEFGLSQGLADTSKTKIKKKSVTQTGMGASSKIKEVFSELEVHKVQILDPATGTGTFLAEVVKQIYKKFEGKQGIWSKYVTNDLIPRLNGFELLMASYSMAHLKMDMLLSETGYKPADDQRFRIFLTNSLEEAHPDTATLFSSWLSDEADQANAIKRDAPVMVVIGNPPYSGESANKGDWIMNLMEDYKKEPGGQTKLNERNPKWINDDYVKFIRFGQHFINKNGEGILAFINPHGFLDNPTFRGLRWSLLNTYDKIYIIDLHGNSNKKELSPDGSIDQNVFDIKQGVSINIFVKTGIKKSGQLAEILHHDLYGKREFKYNFLTENSISSIPFTTIQNKAPMYLMVKRDSIKEEKYYSGIGINELFKISNVGIVTSRDNFVIEDNSEVLKSRIKDFYELDSQTLQQKYNLRESSSWKIEAVKDKTKVFDSKYITRITYRPFDDKYIYYNDAFLERSRPDTMKHFVNHENLGLVTARSNKSETCDHFFISKNITEAKCGERTTQSALFPLYLYSNRSNEDIISTDNRIPNFNLSVINQISDILKLTFSNEKQEFPNCFCPIDLLDYIYAVLYSPKYRETYKDYLKSDFPRVPIPSDHAVFWKLVKLGGELRQVHLLQGETLDQTSATFDIDGSDIVTKAVFTNGNVYINETQFFGNVPEVAWDFYIGGYQPAQKWLKDRKDRELLYEDILHYQKIIFALNETHRLMNEIDKFI